jgi:hypothetical protein
MIDPKDLLSIERRELTQMLIDGYPIEPEALDNTEYKGTSLGVPGFVEKLTWKKFKKTFCRDSRTGELRGWNMRIKQSPIDDPNWEATRLRNGEPKTFGHYKVVPIDGYKMPLRSVPGLMLDYGMGGNAPWDFVRLLRDPVVSLHSGNTDLLLGWSYMDMGIGRFGTPSFFSLQRDCALSHTAHPHK